MVVETKRLTNQNIRNMENVNWLSMILSTLTPTVLGFAWYHKATFGKAWMDSIGMTEEKAQSGNMTMMMGLSLVMAFILSFFLINFNNSPGQEGEFDTFRHGAFHGAFIGLVIVMPTFISNGLFEQKSWKNMLINVAYWTVTLAVMGGILDAMNHWPN